MKISGAADLDKVLQQLPVEIARKVLTGAVMSGAGVVVSTAKSYAPIDSGELQKSIRRRALKNRGGASVTVAVGPGKAFWGMFQEFGTRYMPARPWLRPAFDASKQVAVAQIGFALGAGIERAAKRLAGSFAKSGLATRRGVVSRVSRLIG